MMHFPRSTDHYDGTTQCGQTVPLMQITIHVDDVECRPCLWIEGFRPVEWDEMSPETRGACRKAVMGDRPVHPKELKDAQDDDVLLCTVGHPFNALENEGACPICTPSRSIAVTLLRVRICTPSVSRSRAARFDDSSVNIGRMRGPASIRITVADRASMTWKSLASV